ncbi:hypothetical protein KP509_04G048800 [Ceratopteris richardii]|uniref:Uncharacterized protein n=1 Tax=Ceratopteris richardii TaxID=49495 RepID=A0A8T2UWS6_CERRI|nr:hypothetical protein KP509_04G048800 [Ceratopteris richardii]
MVERSNRTLYNYDITDALCEAGALPPRRLKRLRRLPHLFCRQLELPVAADSPVQVEESLSSFIFKASRSRLHILTRTEVLFGASVCMIPASQKPR